jgi:cytochrome c556
MLHYDPDTPPVPAAWLSADESVRFLAVETWHRKAGIKAPNEKLHAVMHAIVENQIAGELDAVVRAMARLSKQGLSRHDSVHAVSWVLALHLHDMFSKPAEESSEQANARYVAAVERLTAEAWRAQEEV